MQSDQQSWCKIVFLNKGNNLSSSTSVVFCHLSDLLALLSWSVNSFLSRLNQIRSWFGHFWSCCSLCGRFILIFQPNDDLHHLLLTLGFLLRIPVKSYKTQVWHIIFKYYFCFNLHKILEDQHSPDHDTTVHLYLSLWTWELKQLMQCIS